MNSTQILSVIRSLVAAAGGIALAFGYVTQDQLAAIGGAIGTMIPVVWGIVRNTDNALIAKVESLGDVQQVLVARSSTAALHGPKVISPAEALALLSTAETTNRYRAAIKREPPPADRD